MRDGSKGAAAYKKLSALIAKNPGVPVRQLAKKHGINQSMYYRTRLKLEKPKRVYTKRQETLTVPTAQRTHIPVLMCTPEQIMEMFK